MSRSNYKSGLFIGTGYLNVGLLISNSAYNRSTDGLKYWYPLLATYDLGST
jgi:hypothetical protein